MPDENLSGWRLAAALTVVTFIIYVAGACRTIYVGDSGELVTAVHTLGIPHPTSYPLYVLLGKLWTLVVPIGSIAFRMSLFSAACAAATVGLVSLVARRLGASTLASTMGAGLLAFGPSFWSQANVQRVYALNALLLAAALVSTLAWYRDRRPGRLACALFLGALGASNHTFMVVWTATLGLFVVIVEPMVLRRPRTLVAGTGAVVAGLLPYAYLPLRSRQDPRLDWGDPETLDRFLAVVTRRNFWHRAWYESPADLLVIARDYVTSFGPELAWGGVALAVLGAVAWARRDGRLVLLLPLGMLANVVPMAVHGSRSDLFHWHRYYIPSYLLLAVAAALGAQAVIHRLPRRMAPALLLLPALLLVTGYRDADRSRYRLADDFSRTLLASLPPGAHLAASDDNILFVLMYLQWVEGARPDIDLILQGVSDTPPPLRFDPDRSPFFFTHHPNWNLPQLAIVPAGMVFQVVRAGSAPPEPVFSKTRLDGEDDPRVPKDYLTQNLLGHFHYLRGVAFETRDWARAEAAFQRAQRVAPNNDVLFYNLGLIYQRNDRLGQALQAFRRADAINPRPIPSASPVRARDRIVEIEAAIAAR